MHEIRNRRFHFRGSTRSLPTWECETSWRLFSLNCPPPPGLNPRGDIRRNVARASRDVVLSLFLVELLERSKRKRRLSAACTFPKEKPDLRESSRVPLSIPGHRAFRILFQAGVSQWPLLEACCICDCCSVGRLTSKASVDSRFSKLVLREIFRL